MQRLRGETASSAAMRESLEEVIEESERKEPALSQQERVMLANLLGFGELKVSDVMVPRAQIMAADEELPMAGLVTLFREAKHSRLPVYRETLDDPTGLVHVKDVLALLEPDGAGGYRLTPSSIAKVKRPILFVPPSMRALDLLLKMQTSHTHLALVIDEYGGTDGLVSIEDIIEEIVGDITDEHDVAAPSLKRDGDGFIADARLALEDFRNQSGIDLALPETGEEVDSLGGLVAWLAGGVPQRGAIIAHPAGYEFEVLESRSAPHPPACACGAKVRSTTPLHDRQVDLDRLGVTIRGLTGWRRLLFAFLAGAVSALGFAPVEFFPALLLGFAALLLLLDGADESPHPYRKAAVAGWAFAFGQYLIGWHWISYAFLVDPGAHLWQLPFAILILTGGLALYAGIACLVALYFWQDGPARLFIFAALYAAGEWVRGHALTGFPWNLPAYGWGASLGPDAEHGGDRRLWPVFSHHPSGCVAGGVLRSRVGAW